MTIKKQVYIFVAASLTAAACTATTPAKQETAIRGSDCVFFRSVYDWTVLDDHNMVIWAPSHRDAYQIYMLTPLVGLDFNFKLGFVDRDHDGQLCGFSRDEIIVPDRGFPQRSTITAMKRLDAEAIVKLEEQYKVKLTRDTKKAKPQEPERTTAQ